MFDGLEETDVIEDALFIRQSVVEIALVHGQPGRGEPLCIDVATGYLKAHLLESHCERPRAGGDVKDLSPGPPFKVAGDFLVDTVAGQRQR